MVGMSFHLKAIKRWRNEMELMMITSPEIFEQALKAARNAGQSDDVRGLAASLDASLLGRIEEVWDSIEIALRQGYQLGKEKAQALLDNAVAKAEQIVKDAGIKGREVHHILIEKLRAYHQEFIRSALSRFPSLIEVGGKQYKIDTLSFTQKIVL